VDVARYPDLLIGVVPVIDLEWKQKLWRDKHVRGYTAEAVTDTILRRMPDYVNYICPQFSRTHVNFQRVPRVDTSNPFVWRMMERRRRALAAHGLERRSEAQIAAHVGDSCIDVEVARNAGVAAWAVPYGYNAGVPIAHA
jgi:hypothetical protein